MAQINQRTAWLGNMYSAVGRSFEVLSVKMFLTEYIEARLGIKKKSFTD